MKLQLKRSAVLDGGVAKEPTAVQVEYGELCVNYNQGDPALFIKDSLDQIIRIAGSGAVGEGETPSGPTPPPTGNKPGDVFFDTTNNILMYWNGSEWVPIASQENAADIFVGTFAEVDAAIPVDDRAQGLLLWETTEGTLYIWYIDADTKQWVEAVPGGGGGGGSSVSVLPTAPTDADQGDLWYCTEDGRLYVWYEDAATSQWVDASPDSLASVVDSGENWPAGAEENDLFFRTSDGRLYIYYNDGDSLQWVDASPDYTGEVLWERDGTTLKPANDGDDVEIGSGNIRLLSNGAGIFYRPVTTESQTLLRCESDQGTFRNKFIVQSAGNVRIGGDLDADPNAPNISLNADGSSEFGGRVTSPNLFGKITNDTASDFKVFHVYNTQQALPQASKASITADGRIYGTFITAEGGSVISNRTTGANPCFSAQLNGTQNILLRADGQASKPGGGSWTDINSERRLKENLIPLDPEIAWETVKSLPYYQYNFISDPDNIYYGPVVDECPEDMVLDIIDEDDNGEPKLRSDDQGALRTYNNLLRDARMFVALQTALTRIEALEAEVQALKGGN